MNLAKPIPELTTAQLERFWAKVNKTSGGCWQWTGSLVAAGYGRFNATHSTCFNAHRISYTLARGPVAADLHLDHLCRNRGCVNPDHLEAVTRKENILRGTSPYALNSRKTHCPKGHELDLVRTSKRGRERACSRCVAESGRKSEREHASARSDSKVERQKPR